MKALLLGGGVLVLVVLALVRSRAQAAVRAPDAGSGGGGSGGGGSGGAPSGSGATGGAMDGSATAGAAAPVEYEPKPSDPLGIRNRNPMNLRDAGIAWRGRIGANQGYVVFDRALNGIRAGMLNLHTYFQRDHRDTVRKIVTAWAPSHENPTDAYVQFVASRLGVAPDQRLSWHVHVIPLARAIVSFENGRDPYPLELYQAALAATGKA